MEEEKKTVECSAYITTYAFGPGHRFTNSEGVVFMALSVMHHWYQEEPGIFYALVDVNQHDLIPPVWVSQNDLMNPERGWVTTEPSAVLEA